jgi:hypothetical protein
MFASLPSDIALNEIWNSKALSKLKVFAWLLFLDRLNTRDIMQRKHWHLESGFNCELCRTNVLETVQHLFFECEFARQCWEFVNVNWDASVQLSQNYMTAKAAFNGPCFFDVFACATWNIWKIRNDLIFNHTPISVAFRVNCYCTNTELNLPKFNP